MEWPSVAEVHAYREQVYRLVTSVIQTAPDGAISDIDPGSPYWALPMAIEHERIHVETSSVLIRELPLEDVARPAMWPGPHVSGSGFDGDGSSGSGSGGSSSPPRPPVNNPLVPVAGGPVRLGKPRDFPRCGTAAAAGGGYCVRRWGGGLVTCVVCSGGLGADCFVLLSTSRDRCCCRGWTWLG